MSFLWFTANPTAIFLVARLLASTDTEPYKPVPDRFRSTFCKPCISESIRDALPSGVSLGSQSFQLLVFGAAEADRVRIGPAATPLRNRHAGVLLFVVTHAFFYGYSGSQVASFMIK